MTTVNNATGVYATLGYNYTDPNNNILELSANTQAHLNTMPAFIVPWQAQDIANHDVGGYMQNPLAEVSQNIMDISNTIITICSQANGVVGLETVNANAHQLLVTANAFLFHTNRLSGLDTRYDEIDKPYYRTAMNMGKTAMYVTNQTDNITNTSPILGCFTSLLIGPQINANTIIVSTDSDLLANSIIFTGNEISGITATTNLSPTQITQIQSDIANTNSLLLDRYNGDLTYYSNLRTFVDEYNTTKQYVNLGESERYLLQNFVGSTKLLSRINS